MPLFEQAASQDRIIVPCTEFVSYVGTPVIGPLSTNLRIPFMRFDQSGSEGAYAILAMPTGWNKANFFMWTLAPDAVAANDVEFIAIVGTKDDGTLSTAGHTISTYVGSPNPTVMAISGTRYTIQKHALNTNVDHTPGPLTSGLWLTQIFRQATSVADTYAGDIGFVALGIERVY